MKVIFGCDVTSRYAWVLKQFAGNPKLVFKNFVTLKKPYDPLCKCENTPFIIDLLFACLMKYTLDQWFPNFSGARTTCNNLVVRKAQNIDLCRDSRTTSGYLTDH